MKAAFFNTHGGPEVIQYGDVAQPQPGKGEVLVRVKAAALNHLDIWIRNGIPAYKTALPHIGGCDVSGVIEAAGEGVEGLAPGRDVVLAPGLSCFRCGPCLSGLDNRCDSYRILGAGRWGGFAEFVTAPSINALPKPAGLSFEEAAAFPLTFLTAWHMLIGRAGLQPGATVLVIAAGSGVGAAAVRIARLAGARVIATAGSEEKMEKARSLGAQATVNHYKESVSARAREFTDGEGVDVVFEHVGPATWKESALSLKKGGVLVTCGSTTGPEIVQDLRFVFSRELTVLGSMMGRREELLKVNALMDRGALKPVVHSVLPLSELAEAHRMMEAGKPFGKIVLTPQ